MGRRRRALTDGAKPATLLRVRPLVFEPLERRSVLAADAGSCEVDDPTVLIEPAADEPVDPVADCIAGDVEQQFEPQIAVCWFGPREVLPGYEPPVLLVPQAVEPESVVSPEQEPSAEDAAGDDEAEPAVEPAEADAASVGSDSGTDVACDDAANADTGGDLDAGVPLWQGVSLEVVRDGSDDACPTVIHESEPESVEPEIVTCTGVIDWVTPAAWSATDDAAGSTLVPSESLESDDEEAPVEEPVDGEAGDPRPEDVATDGPIVDEAFTDGVVEDAAVEDSFEFVRPTVCSLPWFRPQPVSDPITIETDVDEQSGEDASIQEDDSDSWSEFVAESGLDHTIYVFKTLRSVMFFARSATAAGGSQLSSTSFLGAPDASATAAADGAVTDAAVNAMPDAVASRATTAGGQSDVTRLFAAFAQGVGQGSVDHLAGPTVGGRRGARR